MTRDTARRESASRGSHDRVMVALVDGDEGEREDEEGMRGNAFLDLTSLASSNGASLKRVLEIGIESFGKYLTVTILLLAMRLE